MIKFLPPWRCYRCGDMYYLVRDCPYYMDIYQLTSEQWEKLIEDLLVLKDAVLLEKSCLLEEKDFV